MDMKAYWGLLTKILIDKGAFIYDVRCFWGIFDLPTTYPNQILYYISLFSKIRSNLTYLKI